MGESSASVGQLVPHNPASAIPSRCAVIILLKSVPEH